jgi:uncharacterized membrane protein
MNITVGDGGGGARHRRNTPGGVSTTAITTMDDNDLTEPLALPTSSSAAAAAATTEPLETTADHATVSSSAQHHESHMRSIVKGLTWRVVATSTTTLIAWLITGEVDMALKIGFFEFFAKLMIYYAHERIWIQCIPLR